MAAKEHHTLLEINNSSLKPTRNKPNARENNLSILRLCKRYEVPVILGSDAHISFDIARYDYLYDLLQLTEFPESLIMNRDVKSFKEYLLFVELYEENTFCLPRQYLPFLFRRRSYAYFN